MGFRKKNNIINRMRTGAVSDSSLQRAVAACELLQHASGFIKVLKDEIYLLAAVEMGVLPYVAPLQCDVELGNVLDPTCESVNCDLRGRIGEVEQSKFCFFV